MKKTLLGFVIIFSISKASAQSISMETISTGGDFYTSSKSMLSITGGEVTSGTYKTGNNIITQGFEQTYHTYWIGSVSSAWENPLNWNGPFPGIHTDIIIRAGLPNNPVVGSNVFCRRLFTRPGAIITVNTGFKLTITK